MSGLNELDRWIYLDGPEPEPVRSFLDVLRELPPSTPADKALRARRFFEALDAELAQTREPASTEDAAEASDAAGEDGAEGALRAESALHAESAIDAATHEAGGSTARSPVVQLGLAGETGVERMDTPRPRIDVLGDRAVDAPAAKAPESLAGTVDMVIEIPADVRDKLPFRTPGPDPHKVAKDPGDPDPAPPRPGGDRRREHRGGVEEGGREHEARALPFVAPPVGATVMPLPELTVEQYTSLRAELAVMPEAVGEILPRYGVSDGAALAALNAHWEREMRERPEVRAAFEGLWPRYVEWVRGRGR